ncbi:hypothetical protein BKA70DRAFT_1066115, partial [Coprinopsis sp. MPI-PUGE-AT-0042]
FEDYFADVEVDGEHSELALWDTADQEDYNRPRPLGYLDSHITLIYFAVGSPDSLDNDAFWFGEGMHFCAGLRRDPRVVEESRKASQRLVSPNE